MIETDNAYAAGIVDGEGSILISADTKRTWLCITVSNTDPRVCEWLKERYGGYIRHDQRLQPNGRPRRILYHWRVLAATAGKFLITIHPYLVIKKEQADIALAYLKTKGKGGARIEPGDWLVRNELIERLNEVRQHRPPLRTVK